MHTSEQQRLLDIVAQAISLNEDGRTSDGQLEAVAILRALDDEGYAVIKSGMWIDLAVNPPSAT